jgi:hypothetical protein
MYNKIVLEKGTFGGWKCTVKSSNGKGDFVETKVGDENKVYFKRIDLLELAIEKLGIKIEHVINGQVI